MFLKSFLLLGSNQDEHHKHIATSFIYRNRYKFYATLNTKDITDVSHSLPNVLSCTPNYANLFCFKRYFDFLKWKILNLNMGIKIEVFYDTYQEILSTVSRSVSLFTCTDIRSIQEGNKIFDDDGH